MDEVVIDGGGGGVPVRVVPRRRDGFVLRQGPSVVYLSAGEAEALVSALNRLNCQLAEKSVTVER